MGGELEVNKIKILFTLEGGLLIEFLVPVNYDGLSNGSASDSAGFPHLP